MKQEILEKVNELLEELGTEEYEVLKNYNGYKVFSPVYKKMTITGFPLFILVKNDEVRFCTTMEGFEILEANKSGEEMSDEEFNSFLETLARIIEVKATTVEEAVEFVRAAKVYEKNSD